VEFDGRLNNYLRTSEVPAELQEAGVPATFLVGPDGKVVAKDLTGQALHDELEKLFPAVAQASPK